MIDRPAALYEIEKLEQEIDGAIKLIERQQEVLDECEDYFANRLDSTQQYANEEMRIFMMIRRLRGE